MEVAGRLARTGGGGASVEKSAQILRHKNGGRTGAKWVFARGRSNYHAAWKSRVVCRIVSTREADRGRRVFRVGRGHLQNGEGGCRGGRGAGSGAKWGGGVRDDRVPSSPRRGRSRATRVSGRREPKWRVGAEERAERSGRRANDFQGKKKWSEYMYRKSRSAVTHLIRGGHICGGSNRPHVSQRLVVRCDFASDHD